MPVIWGSGEGWNRTKTFTKVTKQCWPLQAAPSTSDHYSSACESTGFGLLKIKNMSLKT